MAPLDFVDAELEALRAAGLLRHLREVRGAQGREVELDGRRVVNFSSNNYLGLANHPEVVEAGRAALERSGAGAGASRLIVGSMVEHGVAEQAFAEFHGTDAALLFSSGYQANVGTIQALCGDGCEVFSDELNHASIIDGCRLAKARVSVFRHSDIGHLESLLSGSVASRKLIVSDALFSMDGDAAELRDLSELAEQYDAGLMVDEAHAVGVWGDGRGLCAELGVVPDVLVGTLGKAFGGFGAYVAGSSAIRELLLNRARSFVFSTALPPAVAAANAAALRIVSGPEGARRRAALSERVAQLGRGLETMGLPSSASAIMPVVVGDEGRAMEACEALLDRGVYAQGIRPPTVPRGTSRMRFALMATHTADDVDLALAALRELVERGLVPLE